MDEIAPREAGLDDAGGKEVGYKRINAILTANAEDGKWRSPRRSLERCSIAFLKSAVSEQLAANQARKHKSITTNW